MKKVLALILALCLMISAFASLAESAQEKSGEGTLGFITDILGGEGSIKEKAAAVITFLSNIKDNFSGSREELTVLLKGLISKLKSSLSAGGEELSGLLDILKGALKSGGDFDIGALLGNIADGAGSAGSKIGDLLQSLTGGGDNEGGLGDLAGGLLSGLGLVGGSQEEEPDDETIEETLARLKAANEAITGDEVPDRRTDTVPEDFYGYWIESKMVYDGEEWELTDNDEGAFIGENTFYITENGEKSADSLLSEDVEMRFENGMLRLIWEDACSNYVLTQEDEMVLITTNFLVYYVRADK